MCRRGDVKSHDRSSHQVDMHADDSDLQKGATESPEGQGNANADQTLDDEGLPRDKAAIAEDVGGANVDQSQG
jgi:hypothetical protein